MLAGGRKSVLITRMSADAAEIIAKDIKLTYYADAKVGIAGEMGQPDGTGTVVVATGGTSDTPVAEEAALTAEFLGSKVERLYDVGVAGLHRLLSRLDILMSARVVVAVAGMEGALPSVIGGLVDCPVIAVPTSIGYGASLGGIAALLSMLNSCASGISVVNIDNGFGAGYLASMINHIGGNEK
jgi:NCAIR mutase (PurE)-related protein